MIVARADERWKLRHIQKALTAENTIYVWSIEYRESDILWGDLPWVLVRELKPNPTPGDLAAACTVPVDLSDFEECAA